MIVYHFDKEIDANKWFEIVVPVATLYNKRKSAFGFATLAKSSIHGEGYYEVKEIGMKFYDMNAGLL